MLNSLSLPVINRMLSDDPWAMRRLAAFSGSTLRVTLADKPVVRYSIEPSGLLAAHEVFGHDEPTLSIDLPADTTIRFIRHGRHDVLKAAKIRGNIDLANAVSEVIENVRPDPEAFLANKIGDIAAHRVMGFFTSLKGGVERLATRLKDQFTEHIAEGHSVIAPNEDVTTFITEVDTLRNDVARLQQRVDRLLSR